MELSEITNLEKYKRIHLIGIGGVSMSAIAETLKNWGYVVTGSDLNASTITDTLISHGIETVIGHSVELASKADLIIYSAAISPEDPEMILAKEKDIPIIDRGHFVGYLTQQFNEAICVSGTHGKTTTTSLLAICFVNAHLDPTVEVGALLSDIGGNYRIGNSDYFILESCEYKANFLKFFPDTAIILNMDNDHLDYYKTFDNIVKAFNEFAMKVPKNGLLVTNADDENCYKLKDIVSSKFISYGIENQNADFIAKNISFDKNGFAYFDIYKNNKLYESIHLSIAGIHNVLNSLACVATCDYYGIDKSIIKKSLESYKGAERRLEYKGSLNDIIPIFDDYAHHPTEIAAIAKAIKNKTYNKSWVVFQPHTYSRTINLLDDFASALSNFDNIILLDIYAAREKNPGTISSKDLADKLVELGKNTKYIPDFDEVVSFLKSNVKDNDIIITLGAGTVTKIGPMLLK